MLSKMIQLLAGADALDIRLTRGKDGKPKLLMQPQLGPEPAHFPVEALPLRAALAHPLLVTVDTDAELDTAIERILSGAAPARNNVLSSLAVFEEQMKAAVEASEKAAAEAKAKREAKAATPPATAATKKPGPAKKAGKQSAPPKRPVSLPRPTGATPAGADAPPAEKADTSDKTQLDLM